MFTFYSHSFELKHSFQALGFLKTHLSLVGAGESEKLRQSGHQVLTSTLALVCRLVAAGRPKGPSVHRDRKPPGWQVLVLACIRVGLKEHGRLG